MTEDEEKFSYRKADAAIYAAILATQSDILAAMAHLDLPVSMKERCTLAAKRLRQLVDCLRG